MKLVTRDCPKCGAPVGSDEQTECKYCGAALERAPTPLPPPAPPPARPYPELSAVRSTGAGAGAGCTMMVALAAALLVAGGVAFTVLSRPAPASRVGVTTTSTVEVVTSDGLELLENKCSSGDAPSCVAMGAVYQYGHGRPVDLDEARARYDRACQLGDTSGCSMRDMLPRAGASSTPPEKPIARPRPAPTPKPVQSASAKKPYGAYD